MEGEEGGHGGCIEGGSVERKPQLKKEDETEGLHGAVVGNLVKKPGNLARKKRWIGEEKTDKEVCTSYLLFWTNSCKT